MSELAELVDRYEKQADRIGLCIRGLMREDLLTFPVPGTWSIQQIVLHLVDADLVFTDRAKRIIAEDEPAYPSFDESRYAQRLFYDEQSAEDAAALFALNRRNFARVLRKLPADAFARIGTHSIAGRQALASVIEAAIGHVDHHVKFIIDKREILGKIMW